MNGTVAAFRRQGRLRDWRLMGFRFGRLFRYWHAQLGNAFFYAQNVDQCKAAKQQHKKATPEDFILKDREKVGQGICQSIGHRRNCRQCSAKHKKIGRQKTGILSKGKSI